MATSTVTGKNYLDIANEATAPIRERKTLVCKNGESMAIRRYHLLEQRQSELLKNIEATGKFISPYGPNRLYTTIVDSILLCGENDAHAVGKAFASFKDLMSRPSTVRNNQTDWDRFNTKSPRNETTHLTAFPRYIYNLEVLQRLGGKHPYGLKLAQLGACIDITVDGSGMLFVKLRTNIPEGQLVLPLNTNRKRKSNKPCRGVPSRLVISKVECTIDANDSDDEQND